MSKTSRAETLYVVYEPIIDHKILNKKLMTVQKLKPRPENGAGLNFLPGVRYSHKYIYFFVAAVSPEAGGAVVAGTAGVVPVAGAATPGVGSAVVVAGGAVEGAASFGCGLRRCWRRS